MLTNWNEIAEVRTITRTTNDKTLVTKPVLIVYSVIRLIIESVLWHTTHGAFNQTYFSRMDPPLESHRNTHFWNPVRRRRNKRHIDNAITMSATAWKPYRKSINTIESDRFKVTRTWLASHDTTSHVQSLTITWNSSNMFLQTQVREEWVNHCGLVSESHEDAYAFIAVAVKSNWLGYNKPHTNLFERYPDEY